MIYEFWDTATINLVGSFEGREEAIAVLRDAIARHGASWVDDLAFVREDADGESHPVAVGRALMKLGGANQPLLTTAES